MNSKRSLEGMIISIISCINYRNLSEKDNLFLDVFKMFDFVFIQTSKQWIFCQVAIIFEVKSKYLKFN